MEIIQVYKCLCDVQRLRILNLLKDGPLCVCHLVDILESDQVRVSKQLRYMKGLGMVRSERQAQWMVYRLADYDSPLLFENLKCLQDCAGDQLCFAQDLEKRRALVERMCGSPSNCVEVLLADRRPALPAEEVCNDKT